MKIRNKLIFYIVPSVTLLIALILSANFVITGKKFTTLQFDLLINNVNHITDKCKSNYETIEALGMSEVEYYRNFTKSSMVSSITKDIAPLTSIAIIDTLTRQIYFSTDLNEARSFFNNSLIQSMIEKIQGHTEFESLSSSGNKVTMMAAFGECPEWNWIAVSYVNKDQLSRYTQDVLNLSLVLAGIFLIFIFQAMQRLSRTVTRSLDSLEAGARRLSQDNFDVEIKADGNDEFSKLAHCFNVMAAEIRKTHNKLSSAIADEKRTNQDLKTSEQRRTLALFGADLGLWDWNIQTNSVVYDDRWCGMIGRSVDNVAPFFDSFLQLLHQDDKAATQAIIDDYLSGGRPYYAVEFRMQHLDGHWVWILAKGKVVERDENNLPLRMTGTHMDITERKLSESKLLMAASVFEHALEGILITRLDGVIIDVNKAFTRITGFSRAEALGKNQAFLSSVMDKREYSSILRKLHQEGYWVGERFYRRKNGEKIIVTQATSIVSDNSGQQQHCVSLFSDITQIKEHQRQLEHLAHYDALTNLPNRTLLADFMKHTMAQIARRGKDMAVIYLDLDGFKVVNDRHGHHAGDQLLIASASRMLSVLRKGDMLARLGGDEFAVILTDLDNYSNAFSTLDRLLVNVSKKHESVCQDESITASIGIVFHDGKQQIDAEQLLRQADQAMYQAKMLGGNRYIVFDAEHDSYIRARHETHGRIRLAIENEEFVLFYQPKVNMRTGQIIGAEALVRWQHPEKGLLCPGDFLDSVEDHPLAILIGEWVIDAAMTQRELWLKQGMDIHLSVNIGALQLQQDNFLDCLQRIFHAHPLVHSNRFEIEILETSTLKDMELASRVIDACREMGVTFALDDFGTGYSSLTYLKKLGVSQLKIDQSFVKNMLEDSGDLAIIKGVMGLAAAFKCSVIAEGVESVEHGLALLELNCDVAQGYGIAKPMPADQFYRWSRSWKPDPSWTAERAMRDASHNLSECGNYTH